MTRYAETTLFMPPEGWIMNGIQTRITKPIRNRSNKSGRTADIATRWVSDRNRNTRCMQNKISWKKNSHETLKAVRRTPIDGLRRVPKFRVHSSKAQDNKKWLKIKSRFKQYMEWNLKIYGFVERTVIEETEAMSTLKTEQKTKLGFGSGDPVSTQCEMRSAGTNVDRATGWERRRAR